MHKIEEPPKIIGLAKIKKHKFKENKESTANKGEYWK